MKLKKIWIALMASVLLMGQLIPLAAAIPEIPFTDVPLNEWYYADVRNAYNMSLIDGRSHTTFAPNDLLTHAEAVKLAACMYQVYTDDAPFVVSAEPWYQIYADYCYEKGIISREYNWNQNITRAAYMDIFSRALPREALPAINTVDDGMIPDVPMSHRYAQSIYILYRAGIVRGQDDLGNCAPDNYVKRSEVAAILTRMMDKTKRIRITLEEQANKQQTPETTQPVTPTPPVVVPTVPSTGGSYPPIIIPGGSTGDWYPGGNTGNAGGSSGNTGSSGGNTGNTEGNTPNEPDPLPWEQPGAKQPSSYTWREYEALTLSQKEDFFESFGEENAFEEWRRKAQLDAVYGELPWENGEKLPNEYTWSEYEALNDAHKEKFFEWFETAERFEEWRRKAQLDAVYGELPWENGGKLPNEYTWSEYEVLNDAHKEKFFEWFETAERFEEWRRKAQLDAVYGELPWENGEKLPNEYTWSEYEALNDAHKEKFFEWFETAEQFEEWRRKAQLDAVYGELPWENGGKLPNEYTWSEYEALNDAHKEKFFEWFEAAEQFEEWRRKAQLDAVYGELPWENGGKLPNEYTWSEYEALNDAHKEKFFEWFETAEQFEEWMNTSQA